MFILTPLLTAKQGRSRRNVCRIYDVTVAHIVNGISFSLIPTWQ